MPIRTYPDGSPRFPGRVIAACALWISTGALIMAASVLLSRRLEEDEALFPLIGLLSGGLLALCGMQPLTGRATGTKRRGVASLLVACFLVLGAVFMLAFGLTVDTGQFLGTLETILCLIASGLALVFAAVFTCAGILAVRGNDGYRCWRAASDPADG